MGNRSTNALVVKSSALQSMPSDVARFLADDMVDRPRTGREALAFCWETNLTPFSARCKGDPLVDLKQELAVMAWALKLSPSDYLWTRVGDDGGQLGEYFNHPYAENEVIEAVEREWQTVVPGAGMAI